MWISKWNLRQQLPEIALDLAKSLNLHSLVARVLAARGINTPKDAQLFLNPSLKDLHEPFLLADMEAAVNTFIHALNADKRITIVGDYDVDGITSSALLLSFLRALGRDANVVIPDRFKHGYGLNSRLMPDVVATGPQLVVTVDCGISSIEQVDLLRNLGIDVIILDHHIPKNELPRANAVVDPLRKDSGFPFRGMAAVGVTFYFLIALRRAMRAAGWFDKGRREPQLEGFLDLVALGTVADSVPLTGENRVFTKRGLQVIGSDAARPGIAALRGVTGLKKGEIRAGHVGFILAPRLNVAGRLDRAQIALDLLMAGNLPEAVKFAGMLHAMNSERQGLEQDVLAQAMAQVESGDLSKARGIVVAGKDWHHGVIGIVASRLVDAYNRPALVISVEGDTAKGSGRSIPGFDLTNNGLRPLQSMLTAFGGHAMAAGFSLSADMVPRFSEAFVDLCNNAITDDMLEPVVTVDTILTPNDRPDPDLVNRIQAMGPFGYGNPEPVFMVSGVRVLSAQMMGKRKDTLVMRVDFGGNPMKFVGFRWSWDPPEPKMLIDVAFTLDISDYDHKIYGRIKALRQASQ